MQKLTVDLLKGEAKAFAEKESRHKEESLYGVTDGKAVTEMGSNLYRLLPK